MSLSSTSSLAVSDYLDLSNKALKRSAEESLTGSEESQIKTVQKIIRRMRGAEKVDAEDYLEDSMEDIRNGKSIQRLADDVPEALEAALEAKDLTVTDVLKKLKKHSDEISTSSVMLNMNMTVVTAQQIISTLNIDEQRPAEEYMQKLFKEIQSGDYDSSDLKSIAPSYLTDALEEQGVAISDVISQISSGYWSFTKSVDYSASLFYKINPKTTIME